MDTVDLAVVAAFVIVFGVVSARLSKTVVTGPMVFVAFGLLVGPSAFGWVDLSLGNEVVQTLAELTLVLVLFADAARIDLRVLRRNSELPIRLLSLGLPLTIAAGTVVGLWLFDLDFWEAAVLAAALAPTDAALGQAVIASKAVPLRIRQALNVESGLNDGIVVPFITVFLAGAGAAEGLRSASYWVSFAAKQIGLGAAIGAGAGVAAGWLIDRGTRNGWVGRTFQQIAVLAVPFLAFAVAESVDGNGFIAAFVAGAAIGNFTRGICRDLFDFSEEEGQLLALLTFMIFGGAFVGPALDEVTWPILLYAVLSLTLVRAVPVFVSQIGVRLRADTELFLGWFGPRGLASIVFGLVIVEESGIAGREQIFLVITWTVLLSILAHGLSAVPGARWYGKRLSQPTTAMPEMQPVEELPTRGMSNA